MNFSYGSTIYTVIAISLHNVTHVTKIHCNTPLQIEWFLKPLDFSKTSIWEKAHKSIWKEDSKLGR